MLNELTSAQAIAIEAHGNKQHQHIVESALQKFISLLTVRTKSSEEKIQCQECWHG